MRKFAHYCAAPTSSKSACPTQDAHLCSSVLIGGRILITNLRFEDIARRLSERFRYD